MKFYIDAKLFQINVEMTERTAGTTSALFRKMRMSKDVSK